MKRMEVLKDRNEEHGAVLVGGGSEDITPPVSRISLECDVSFGQRVHGNRKSPSSPPPERPKRIPSISRILALAIHLDRLAASGDGRTYADLARLGGVSRSRVTQIMGLANLAPDIQGEILALEATGERGSFPSEQSVRPIAGVLNWEEQRRIWNQLRRPMSAR